MPMVEQKLAKNIKNITHENVLEKKIMFTTKFYPLFYSFVYSNFHNQLKPKNYKINVKPQNKDYAISFWKKMFRLQIITLQGFYQQKNIQNNTENWFRGIIFDIIKPVSIATQVE